MVRPKLRRQCGVLALLLGILATVVFGTTSAVGTQIAEYTPERERIARLSAIEASVIVAVIEAEPTGRIADLGFGNAEECEGRILEILKSDGPSVGDDVRFWGSLVSESRVAPGVPELCFLYRCNGELSNKRHSLAGGPVQNGEFVSRWARMAGVAPTSWRATRQEIMGIVARGRPENLAKHADVILRATVAGSTPTSGGLYFSRKGSGGIDLVVDFVLANRTDIQLSPADTVFVRYPETAQAPEAAVGQTLTVFCDRDEDGWQLADTVYSLWRMEEASAVSSPNVRGCKEDWDVVIPISVFREALSGARTDR